MLVIGGGIGGLALAHGLRRAGVPVRVLERTRERTDWLQGYRIHINPAGARALHDLLPPSGWAAFLRAASPGGGFGFLTDRGTDLLGLADDEINAPGAGAPDRHYGIGRIQLREALLDGLGDVLETGCELISYEVDGEQVIAHLADGSTARGAALVGADGANSRVRAQLLPAAAGRVDTGVLTIAGRCRSLDGLPPMLTSRANVVIPRGRGSLFTAAWGTDGTARPSEVTAAPSSRPAAPSGGPADSTDGPADSTGGPADSTGGPADSTGGPADSTGGPAVSTGGPAVLSGRSVAPSSGSAARASRSAAPADGVAASTGDSVPSVGEQVLWGFSDATATFPAGVERLDAEALTRIVDERLRDWAPEFRTLVSRSDPATVNAFRVKSATVVVPPHPSGWGFKLPAASDKNVELSTGRVTLLGDAVHSMTPMAGVGANTALRDAALLNRELAAAFRGETPLLTAIERYEREMLTYGFAAVRLSLRNARQAAHSTAAGRALFRTALRLTAATPPLRRRFARGLGN